MSENIKSNCRLLLLLIPAHGTLFYAGRSEILYGYQAKVLSILTDRGLPDVWERIFPSKMRRKRRAYAQ